VNTINTTLFPTLDFDFSGDMAAVASFYRVPLVVEVNPSLPIGTPPEFLAFAKLNPGKLKVAYAGNGTPQHIGIASFKSMAGVDLTLVPYQGSAPALADLVGGRVDAMFDPIPSSIALIREGKLRPIAVTTPDRSPALPDVPTMSSALPGYEANSWFGIAAPKNTPSEVIVRLNGVVNEGLADPKIRTRIAELGGTVMAMSPTEFAKFIASETDRHARVIRAAGIKVN
jgi:tripartite-type tricarboxylate transporter receptor subunit TctC